MAVRAEVAAFVVLGMLIQPVWALDPIEVLAIGSVGPAQSPIPDWLSLDSAFELSLVPTRLYDVLAITPDEARRMLRLYFPRSQQALRAYECLLYSGGDVRYFTPDKIAMMVKAVESGVAAVTDMGGMSRPLHDTWIASGLWEVFPNDVLSIKKLWDAGAPSDQAYRIIANSGLDNNPLFPFLSLGIEELVGGRSRIIHPRFGSTTYAWMEAQSLIGWELGFIPSAASIWTYGKGRTLALEGWFGHSWWSAIIDETQNEYGLDILVNYLLDVSGRPYFEDIPLVHSVRHSFSEFQDYLSFIGDLFDFVERFGANTNSLNRELMDIREEFESSRDLYREGDMEGALRASSDSVARLSQLRERAMRLRDKALQWIYVIEWLSVTSSLMVTAYILDLLMIRRRLYREMPTTRAKGLS